MYTIKVYEKVGMMAIETGTFKNKREALDFIYAQLSPKFESRFRMSKCDDQGNLTIMSDLYYDKKVLNIYPSCD